MTTSFVKISHILRQDGNVYAGVEGISFHENGSFWLNLVKTHGRKALFNSDDIELIMKHGITGIDLIIIILLHIFYAHFINKLGASLALTDPLGSEVLPHPFVNATWAPYDTLIGTDSLHTLLHADIWLKSLSLHAEMSARSPFRTQSMDQSTFAAQAPDLYQRLFSNNSLKDNDVYSNVNIWIESGLMNFNRIEENGTVTYFLGPANMQVKHHSMLR